MADFEEKLNALLSSPESMQQVAQLAQMLAQQNGGAAEGPGGTVPPEGPPPPAPAEEPSLASLFGGLDPSSLARLLPLLQELSGSQNDERARLLYALKPFLKPARQEKIDTALRLARLFHAGKRFFKEFGGAHV